MAASGAWIPRPVSFRLLQFNCKIPPDVKVADLIDKNSFSWRTDYLVDKVDKDDWDLILSIPVPCTNQPDTIWHYSNNGWFSVTSAYGVTMRIKKERLMCGEAVSRHGPDIC